MFDFQIQRLKQKNHSHTKCKLKKNEEIANSKLKIMLRLKKML
jgi:hypothetical protein